MGRGEEVDLGRGVQGARVGEGVWREGRGQVDVEQLQTLLLGGQAQDLVLQPLVLLLQGVQRLQHVHDYSSRNWSIKIQKKITKSVKHYIDIWPNQ